MKKIILICMILLSLFLSSCYKKETTTFEECTYQLNHIVPMEDASKIYDLTDATMNIKKITKDDYESSDYNVLESRYNEEYYQVQIILTINNMIYDNINFYEIKGSSNYNNRYYLWFLIEINDISYQCLFRMDLSHYVWINEFEEDRANSINVTIEEIEFKDEDKTNYVVLNDYICFDLIAST